MKQIYVISIVIYYISILYLKLVVYVAVLADDRLASELNQRWKHPRLADHRRLRLVIYPGSGGGTEWSVKYAR